MDYYKQWCIRYLKFYTLPRRKIIQLILSLTFFFIRIFIISNIIISNAFYIPMKKMNQN